MYHRFCARLWLSFLLPVDVAGLVRRTLLVMTRCLEQNIRSRGLVCELQTLNKPGYMFRKARSPAELAGLQFRDGA